VAKALTLEGLPEELNEKEKLETVDIGVLEKKYFSEDSISVWWAIFRNYSAYFDRFAVVRCETLQIKTMRASYLNTLQ